MFQHHARPIDRATRLVTLALLAVGTAWPAGAADAPQAVEGSQNIRAFTLKNAAEDTIVEAHAITTTGRDIEVTKAGPIRPQLAQNFMMTHGECLARVSVRFRSGKTVAGDRMNDCTVSRVLAHGDAITVDSVAGGPVFPSEASRDNPGGAAPPQP